MPFYPDDQPVPDGLTTDEFILRPLRTSDTERDHAALMVSKEMLRRWGGSEWPTDSFTLEENHADLLEHQQEHEQRIAFTYTVLAPDGEECLGCVYLTPLLRLLRRVGVSEEELATVGEGEAIVRFWTKEPRLADDLDVRLFETLRAWLPESWPFPRVLFSTNEQDERQLKLFGDKGLVRRYALDRPTLAGRTMLYGEASS